MDINPFAPRWETEPPDFINELGNKWWANDELKGCHIWVVQLANTEEYIFVATKNNEIICEDTGLEALCCKIDCYVLINKEP